MKTLSTKAGNTKAQSTAAKAVRTRECRAIFAALSEFVDGSLPARNCREVRKHFDDCAPCLEYLRTLEKTIRACQAYQSASAPPPSPFVREAFRQALAQTPDPQN